MNVIVVDDKIKDLRETVKAIIESVKLKSLVAFVSPLEALTYIKKNQINIAFLAIDMREINGIILAKKIKENQKKCKIIFCVRHSDYELDGLKFHGSGFVTKPMEKEYVQREIGDVKTNGEKILTVKCFGEFEVYKNGEPVIFKRGKTKELFAYMIDRKGVGLTINQMCVGLWENYANEASNKSYLRNLITDLRQTLKDINAEEVFEKRGKEYFLKMQYIDCDYVDYLENKNDAFEGEYMNQYSWAETTLCGLESHQKRLMAKYYI